LGQIPFLFCRYELTVDEEPLSPRAQLTALKELQGHFYPNGPTAEREGLYDTVVMRPRSFTLDGDTTVLTWSIGQKIKSRVAVNYDRNVDHIERRMLEDGSIRYADFVGLPNLRIFAVDDRQSPEHMGGLHAGHLFRSVFRQLDGADASVIPAGEYADIRRAMRQWKIASFNFTIRPLIRTRRAKMLRDSQRPSGRGK
jgi:hypothetical protein